jgi:hypothetical protein
MRKSRDCEYFTRHATVALEMARRATTSAERRIHLEVAADYDDWAKEIASGREPMKSQEGGKPLG